MLAPPTATRHVEQSQVHPRLVGRHDQRGRRDRLVRAEALLLVELREQPPRPVEHELSVAALLLLLRRREKVAGQVRDAPAGRQVRDERSGTSGSRTRNEAR